MCVPAIQHFFEPNRECRGQLKFQNIRGLFLGVGIAGVAVPIFAVTRQTLLAAAQERRAGAAASLARVKRHD